MKYLKKQGIFLIIFLVIVGSIAFSSIGKAPQKMDYSRLLTEIQSGNVNSIVLQSDIAEVQLNKALDQTSELTKYEVTVPPDITSASDRFTQAADNQLIKSYSITQPLTMPWWSQIVLAIGFIILLSIWSAINQKKQGGGLGGNRAMELGKSRAKLSIDDQKTVSFADVAGADEVKEELEEIAG